MITPKSLRGIIRLSLQQITTTKHPLWTLDAEEILVMIAAHESKMGKSIRQLGGGPGRGLWQVELGTLQDNYKNFINKRQDLLREIAGITGVDGYSEDALQFNPLYGCIQARLKLYRAPGKLPFRGDVRGMAEYAKAYFNSTLGKATPEKYINDYMAVMAQDQGGKSE